MELIAQSNAAAGCWMEAGGKAVRPELPRPDKSATRVQRPSMVRPPWAVIRAFTERATR